MKKFLLGLTILSALGSVLPVHAAAISIGDPKAWKPVVGDDVIYDFYEEQPDSNSVFTGTLEKKVLAVTQFNISVQITLTKQGDTGTAPIVTTKTASELMMNIENTAIEVEDCGLGVGGDPVPVSLKTVAGTFESCLGRPMLGSDLDGDSAVANFYMGYVPFGVVRIDSIKTGNGNHIRTILKQITLGQKTN
jgi:hypothetical protein